MNLLKKFFSQEIKNNNTSYDPICPYCSIVLSKIPSRKTKCQNCGNYYYFKTDPVTREKKIVTEEEKNTFEKMWEASAVGFSGLELEAWRENPHKPIPSQFEMDNYWIKHLGYHNISEKQYFERKMILNSKSSSKVTLQSIAWSLLNEYQLKMMQQKDYQKLKFLHHDMAFIQWEMGQDFFIQLQEANKMELLEYLQVESIKEVSIYVCNDACDECKKNQNKIINIKDALKEMPIPHKKCTWGGDNDGWCRCTYSPIIEN